MWMSGKIIHGDVVHENIAYCELKHKIETSWMATNLFGEWTPY